MMEMKVKVDDILESQHIPQLKMLHVLMQPFIDSLNHKLIFLKCFVLYELLALYLFSFNLA